MHQRYNDASYTIDTSSWSSTV